MLVKVLGKQVVDYVSKQNKPVKGTSLHVCYASDSDKIIGLAVDKIFISVHNQALTAKLPMIALDAEIDIRYNKYGSVEDIEI